MKFALLAMPTVASLAVTGLGQTTLASPTVVDAASFLTYLPSGGALATIFVSGLTGTPGLVTAPSSSPLPYQLAGVEITINNSPAPILAVVTAPAGSTSPSQINFQVPLERNATSFNSASPTAMTLSQEGNGQIQVPVSGAALVYPNPGASFAYLEGAFFADSSGNVIAQHASDYSRVTAQNPAHPGETIVLYGNDLFRVWPPPPIGFPAPAQPAFQPGFETSVGWAPSLPNPLYLLPPTTGQSLQVEILFAGLAPGQIGVEQLNILIPSGITPGLWGLAFEELCPQQVMTCQNRLSKIVLVPIM
jgi:uncharacterized protein (TIGR03437 family)